MRDQAGRDVAVRSWLAVCKWVDDAAPFPGETVRSWIGDLYQRDELVKGKVKLRGRTVDLSTIRCAVFNVSGKWEYVVPPSQPRPSPRSPAVPIKKLLCWTPDMSACS
jgi:polyhydroxyalkanoate synthase